MAFSISGRIAQGAGEALEQVLERRLKEATRQQIERQNAAENLMRQQGIDLQRESMETAKADRIADNALNQKRFDLEDLRYRDAETERATNRNRASDIAGVLNMPGMKPEDQIREISGLAVKSGSDPLKIIEGLTPKKPERVQYTYTDPRTGMKSLRFADKDSVPEGGLDMGNEPQRPTAGSQGEHFWVNRKMPDGSIKETRVSDATYNPQTDEYFDAVARRGKEKTEHVHPQIISYSENLIRKIDDLVGAREVKDDPSTPQNEAKPAGQSRIKQSTAGVGGNILGSDYFPWNTEAKDVKAEMFSVAAELAISALQKMRASSETGGGVGNVALGEMEIMKNAVAAIQMAQSPAQLERQLKIIRDSEQKFLDYVRKDAAEKAKGGGINVAPGGAPPAGGKTETPAERYKRLMGGG